MAGDWIKMRTGLETNVKTFKVARATGLSPESVVCTLYKLASWFITHGKYGKIGHPPSVVDGAINVVGMADALMGVDWLRYENGNLYLGTFCSVGAIRKSLGRKVRDAVLSGASCNACGSSSNLVIDHIIPIVRGGSCDISNLQPLCGPCNARKGRMTMDEFMAANP